MGRHVQCIYRGAPRSKEVREADVFDMSVI